MSLINVDILLQTETKQKSTKDAEAIRVAHIKLHIVNASSVLSTR